MDLRVVMVAELSELVYQLEPLLKATLIEDTASFVLRKQQEFAARAAMMTIHRGWTTIGKAFQGDEILEDGDLRGSDGPLTITRRVFMLREDRFIRVDAEDFTVVAVIYVGQNLAWAILFQHFSAQLLLALNEPVKTTA